MRAIAAGVLGLGILSCLPFSMGTSSHDVFLVNATSEAIVVYEEIRDPEFKRVVAAGATQRSSWSRPLSDNDARRTRLEVDDTSGVRIYCKDFEYRDLEALGWRITITKGINDCSGK